jgi:hypothetical protein
MPEYESTPIDAALETTVRWFVDAVYDRASRAVTDRAYSFANSE